MSTRRFVLSRDSESEAWAVGWQLASHLRACNVVDRYGIAVRKLPGRKADPAWAVLLVDRIPWEPVPAVLLDSVSEMAWARVLDLVDLSA
ncbi:hypothetical protein [Kitasatospora sp. NPDC094011]|uniref:hypothetical protein n=1 Tax=Kitasatospora sp. NPDC094011 TaxID=3364090 RepID=UPI0038177AD1